MVKMVISGGQTGADQGGLEAGRLLGIPTGGSAPKGYRTERGPDRILLRGFGLRESDHPDYPTRTRQNVADSNGTVWFGNTTSPGYRCTYRAKEQLHLPQIGVSKHWIENPSKEEFLDWITKNNIQILNVAGNRESKNPGIQDKVRKFLTETLGGSKSEIPTTR